MLLKSFRMICIKRTVLDSLIQINSFVRFPARNKLLMWSMLIINWYSYRTHVVRKDLFEAIPEKLGIQSRMNYPLLLYTEANLKPSAIRLMSWLKETSLFSRIACLFAWIKYENIYILPLHPPAIKHIQSTIFSFTLFTGVTKDKITLCILLKIKDLCRLSRERLLSTWNLTSCDQVTE